MNILSKENGTSKTQILRETKYVDWSRKKPVDLGLSLTGEFVGGSGREVGRLAPWGNPGL